MKNHHLRITYKIILIFFSSAISLSHATKISIHTTSFLPYSIEAIYLDKFAFPQVNINSLDIPNGKYEVKFKQYRNQKMISTNTYIEIKTSPSSEEQQFSLVILPNGQVINATSTEEITSVEMFSQNRYKKLAQQISSKLQQSLKQRDQIPILIPENDHDNVIEIEKNYDWLSTINAQPTSCTGTFKLQQTDSLSYLTSANSNLTFSYQQKNQQYKAYFDQSTNDLTIPAIGRKLHYSSRFYNGVRFDLFIQPIEKLTDFQIPKTVASPENNTTVSVKNFKVNVQLYTTTKNLQKFLILNHPMYFQELCAFESEGLFYYKNSWTRFVEMITPNLSWK